MSCMHRGYAFPASLPPSCLHPYSPSAPLPPPVLPSLPSSPILSPPSVCEQTHSSPSLTHSRIVLSYEAEARSSPEGCHVTHLTSCGEGGKGGGQRVNPKGCHVTRLTSCGREGGGL